MCFTLALLTSLKNILVAHRGPNWHVKVADFGICKNTERPEPRTWTGTRGYMAPEQCGASESFTKAVDVWALGAVAFCLRTGKPPFPDQQYVTGGDPRSFPIQRLSNSSVFCKDFVLRTMASLPERRLAIEDALAHPWLVDPGVHER